MFRNMAYASVSRRERRPAARPLRRRRPHAGRRRVRQVLLRARARDDLRDADGFRAASGDDPRRGARQVAGDRTPAPHARDQTRCGRSARSRRSSPRRRSCVRNGTCGSPAICSAVHSVLRSYMLTIRGVLRGLEALRMGQPRRRGRPRDSPRLRRRGARGGRRPARSGHRLRRRTRRRAGAVGVDDARTARRARAALRPRDLARVVDHGAAARIFLVVAEPGIVTSSGVMLGVMRGDVETGLYTAAHRVYEGMSYAPSVIAAVLTPAVVGAVRHRPRASPPAGAPRRRGIDGAGGADWRRRVSARRAADDVAVRRRLRRRGDAVSYPVRRPRLRLRDLGAPCHRDLGQPRAAPAHDRHHRARGQRRL